MHTERFGSYMDNRILIVEDEEKIARFLELELRHEGYEADKASNGREGLDKADRTVCTDGTGCHAS